MAISVADNFSYQGTKPLDARVSFDTVAAMAAAVDATLYDGCLSYVKTNKKYYSYDSTNEVDPTTGKWREYSSGGGGGESHGIPSGGTSGQALVKVSNDDYDAAWSDIEAAQGSAKLVLNKLNSSNITTTGDFTIGDISKYKKIGVVMEVISNEDIYDEITVSEFMNGKTFFIGGEIVDKYSSRAWLEYVDNTTIKVKTLENTGWSETPKITAIYGVDAVANVESAHLEKTPIAVTITGDSGTSSGLLITFPNDDAIDNYDLICFEVSAGGGRQHVFADIPTLYQYPEGITFTMSGYNSPGLISTSGLFPYRVAGSLQVVDSSPDVIKMTASYNDNNFKASISSVIGYKVKGGTGEPTYEVVDNAYFKKNNKLKHDYEIKTKGWNGLTNFTGSYVWTDGDNIYCSNGNSQYVLNKSTSTWTAKAWNGLSSFTGGNIWTDGNNIYYSNDSKQYVLNKSTSTWTAKAWNGLTNFDGRYVWTDGDNIYYSNYSSQYILNKSTSTWTAKAWNGLTNFDSTHIWTDGDNIYCSNGNSQYVLNKSTSTWTTKAWNGLSSFIGYYVWTDGNNIYYSNDSSQYVLNKSTSTWTTKTWNGLTNFDGARIWTDGDNIYYSYNDSHYVLNKINKIPFTSLRAK